MVSSATLQSIVESDQHLDGIKKQFTALRQKYAALEKENIILREANGTLKERVHQLQGDVAFFHDQVRAEKPTMCKSGGYLFKGEQGCFCSCCYDVKKLKVHLVPVEGSLETAWKWQCPNCLTFY